MELSGRRTVTHGGVYMDLSRFVQLAIHIMKAFMIVNIRIFTW